MFYDRYVFFCAKKGITPSAAALEMGLQKSTISRWKKDGTDPTDANKLKVAAYFGISVDELMGESDQKEKAPGNAEGLSDEDIKIVEWYRSLTDEQRAAILALTKKD